MIIAHWRSLDGSPCGGSALERKALSLLQVSQKDDVTFQTQGEIQGDRRENKVHREVLSSHASDELQGKGVAAFGPIIHPPFRRRPRRRSLNCDDKTWFLQDAAQGQEKEANGKFFLSRGGLWKTNDILN